MDNLKDDSSDSDEDYEERAERELASQAGSALEETRALHEFTSSLAMSARDNVAIDPDEQSRSAAAYTPGAAGRPKKNEDGRTSYSLALENVRTRS